jgi:hypothetical protein
MRRASLMKKLAVRSLVDLMRLSIEHDGIVPGQRDVS